MWWEYEGINALVLDDYCFIISFCLPKIGAWSAILQIQSEIIGFIIIFHGDEEPRGAEFWLYVWVSALRLISTLKLPSSRLSLFKIALIVWKHSRKIWRNAEFWAGVWVLLTSRHDTQKHRLVRETIRFSVSIRPNYQVSATSTVQLDTGRREVKTEPAQMWFCM